MDHTWHTNRPANLALRGIVAAGLAVDAYVHLRMAEAHDGIGDAITLGLLFRVEAVVAALAAVLVLIAARPVVYAFAFAVAASALVAVLLSVYVDVGPIGPLPDLYEPVWYPDKSLSAVAEAAAAVAAGLLLALRTRSRSAAEKIRRNPQSATLAAPNTR